MGIHDDSGGGRRGADPRSQRRERQDDHAPRSAELGSRVIDPAGLTRAQRSGKACISCERKWPRPPVLAGSLPGGEPLYLCEDCVALAEPEADGTPPTSVGSPGGGADE